ncbi:MAG: DUF4250 domain-containing protein [Vibrionaceae bacterium]
MNLNNFTNMDPNLLLSIVNMKLRDQFSSLASLCAFYEIDEQALRDKLARGGFEYMATINQFR